MTIELRLALYDALRTARNKQDLLPVAFVREPDDSLNVLVFGNHFMKDGNTKNAVAMKLLYHLFVGGAKSVVIVMDSWFVKVANADEARSLPDSLADCPKDIRRECLIAVGNRMGEQGVVLTQEYMRDEAGRRKFGTTTLVDNKLCGRFIFDLRERSLAIALRSLDFNRDDAIAKAEEMLAKKEWKI